MGTRVYVGRIPNRASERDVEYFFRGYGRIVEVVLKNGYGFLEFSDYRDADDAVHDLNGRDLLGERVSVELARAPPRGRYGGGGGWRDSRRDYGRPPPRGGRERRTERTDYRLVVENLSSRVSWQDLKDYMRQAGEVTYTDAHGKKKHQGLVEFAHRSDMKNALEKLDGKELNGRKIKLVEERKRRSPSSSSRSSRSRSRSSRSRSRSKEDDRKKRDKSEEKKSRSRSRSRSASQEKEAQANGGEKEGEEKEGAEEKEGSPAVEKEEESKTSTPPPTKMEEEPEEEAEEQNGTKSEEEEN